MARFRWKRIFSPKARTLSKADAARDRRDPSTAAYFYQRAIDRWGSSYPVLMQLGNALKDSGCFSDAERAYLEAIAIRPREDDAFLQLGHLMKVSGEIDKAESFYRNAISINPLCVDAQMELDMIALSRPEPIVENRYLALRTDMPIRASIVHYQLINQYRWRRG